MVLTTRSIILLFQLVGLARGSSKPVQDYYRDSPYPLSLPLPGAGIVAEPDGGWQDDPSDSQGYQDPPFATAEADDCAVTRYPSQNVEPPTFPPFDQVAAEVYRYRQQQSVNLGSWFVHEQWMTPSLFTCAAGDKLSEIDIASGWGSLDNARAVLEQHWDTFITPSDFEYLATIGINTVRLPIGYWTLGPEFCQGTLYGSVSAVYQNSWPRLLRAIKMASDVGIGVLVDLHGAPGSQNGQQHSGVSDGQVNLFGNETWINKTIAVLTFLTQELLNITNVVGIQILNEPNNVDELPDFYSRAISAMRQVSPAAASFPLYLHDGFDLHRFSDFVAGRRDFVVQDHHSYFVFTPSDESEPASQHTSDVKGGISDDLAAASDHQRRNLVVDEFSCALTDQSLASEDDPVQARKDFCEAQREVYENGTAGWAFWSYKKENCTDDPGWCFRAAVGNSLPSTFFAYGQQSAIDPSRNPTLSGVFAGLSPLSPEASPDFHMSPYSASTPFAAEASFPNRRRDGLHSQRRSRLTHQQKSRNPTRDSDELSKLPVDPSQRAISKGYSDGFLTAKRFALYGMSKLGFRGQYISDSLTAQVPHVIEHGMEHQYTEWFLKGLGDGEARVKQWVQLEGVST